MGWASGRKLTAAVRGLRQVLAIELIVAGRGLDLRAPLAPAAGTAAALASLRTVVAGPGPDRIVSDEIHAAEALLASGALLDAVTAAIGTLD
jgi:histidine ammonia-lyase